jgi:hypothetical protein
MSFWATWGGRSVLSSRSRRTMRSHHASAPNGHPRCTQRSNAASFRLRLRFVDVLDPAGSPGQRPCWQQRLLLQGSSTPAVEADPAPVFGTFDPTGSQPMSFDIPISRVKMVVVLYRKRREPPLIDMTAAGAPAASMPAPGVCQRQPAGTLRQFASLPRPNHQGQLTVPDTFSEP